MKCKDKIPVAIFKKWEGAPALESMRCRSCDAIMPAIKTKDGWFFVHPPPTKREEPMEKYRPSNGTEGDIFYEKWCEKCIHDDPENEKLCPIIGDTMCYDVDDEKYPSEWTYRDDKPCCTNFKSKLIIITPKPDLVENERKQKKIPGF